MKKKILFVTPIYLPAKITGSGILVKNLAENLVNDDFDVSIITSNALTSRYWYDPVFGKKCKNNNEVINGVKIYRLKCNQLISSLFFIIVKFFPFLLCKRIKNKLILAYNGPLLSGIKKILKKNKYDIVYSSPFPLYINKQVKSALKGINNYKPKFIVGPYFHNSIKEYHNPGLKDIFDYSDKIHVLTSSEINPIMNRFEQSKNKFKVIPPLFKIEKNIISKKNFGSSLKNKKIVLFIGNKGYDKGAIHTLRAVSDLYQIDNSYLLIAIGNSTNEWNKEVEKKSGKYLLDFDYLSNEEKNFFISQSDLLCMPSKSDSFGIVYLEAWSYKKPVICSKIPSSIEIVSNNNAGIAVSYNSVKEIKNAIMFLFKNDNSRFYFGKNGYDALLKKYNFKKILKEYEDFFYEI